ncbi:MAG: sigma-70 family RNA polymerase sigma factor [Planctomycetales bacterium]|nr:sigma-70 family RNA polymerase sigma factor [Planctomycetales bacterium]
MSDVVHIIGEFDADDSQSSSELLPLVYDELRRLAARHMALESPDQTLQATALVHEAYLRLVDHRQPQRWDNRRHFFSAASEAMRRILVENARRKQGPKAGGGRERIELSQIAPETLGPNVDLIALNESLDSLAGKYPRAAEVVKLRFFAGLTNDQTASVLNVAVSTVKLDWTYAKSWLRASLADGPTK